MKAKTYTCIPDVGHPVAHNWAVFGATSEQLRVVAGLGGDPAFVERHLSDQMRFFDVNGMYCDPNQPMVYDFVTRLQYAVALHYGYAGVSRPALEAMMLRAAGPTLAMQSATGEIPYGGRSNQFLHNETFFAALCEFYAAWFKSRGEVKQAARFRRAAKRAVDSLSYWTTQPTLRHIKNRYPLDTRYGCESYGYFDKYMVTMGSWAYLAYLFTDETVPDVAIEARASVFTTSPAFHRHFMRAGAYTVQFDAPADPHYDGSGIGRIQRRGAPPFLCLAIPFAAHPRYRLDLTNRTALAIAPGWRIAESWTYADGMGYTMRESHAEADRAGTVWTVARDGMAPLVWACEVDNNGPVTTLTGEGALALTIPVFQFDGERSSAVARDGQSLTVAFNGWRCYYTTNGDWVDTGLDYGNRNGHYRRWEARGRNALVVRIHIDKYR